VPGMTINGGRSTGARTGQPMTFDQLSTLTRISEVALRYLARHGLLPSPIVGGRWRPEGVVDTPELRAWIAARA
jgi:hypothetical protein